MMKLEMDYMKKFIKNIKYLICTIFLALADVSMCECNYGKELKTYCNIKWIGLRIYLENVNMTMNLSAIYMGMK